MFDPGFRAPVSWRGTTSIDGIRVPGKWIVGLTGNYSYNVNGQSSIDRNLNATPRFYLADEGDRPVYVDPSAIVPATGSSSPAASRVSPLFTTVSNTVSDLQGYVAQLSASLTPPHPVLHNKVTLNLSYTLTKSLAQARGTSRVGITGDPFAKSWVRTATPLQAIRMTASARVWWFNVGLTSFVQSGVPFTPLVSGDINGDGNANNDRAFIPDPATTADTALGRQLTQLIANAPAAARQCLTSQLGRMASASHCQTPWQARMDVNASLTPPASWNYNDRLQLTMVMQNASGALVRAFHLENTPLGQSTVSTTPIPTLLYVTGFDPATERYQYNVNQLFGQPTSIGSLRRKFPPLQFQLGMSYKFGGPPINPMSRGLGLREPVGQPFLTDDQRRAAVARLKHDPVPPITQLKDSLALSNDQLARLDLLSKEFNARADSALTPLSEWVRKKGRRIFDSDLSLKLPPVQSTLAKLSADYGKRAQGVLTQGQLRLFNAHTPTKKDER